MSTNTDRPAGVRIVVDRDGRAIRRKVSTSRRKPAPVTLPATHSPDFATRRAEADAADAARARAVRKLLKPRRTDDSGPTRLTAIKLQPSSMERMIVAREITGEMMQAAQEVEAVFRAVAGGSMRHGFRVERGSRGQAAPMAERIAWAHSKRYVPWADGLTRRRDKERDPSLDIVLAVVVEGVSCAECDRKHRVRSGTSKYLVRRGLLEYAQLAGWAPRGALDKFDAEHPGFRVVPRPNRATERVA